MAEARAVGRRRARRAAARWPSRRSTPSRSASRRRSLSSTCGSAASSRAARSAANASPASPAGTNTTPGFVHSWPPKLETEAVRPSAIFSAALAQRRLGDHDRVDRAHLGVDGDRHRTARRAVEDRLAAGERAGEADGGDLGRVHERLADLDARRRQVRERALRQAGVGHRGAQLARDELAGAGVRGMALDDHRAARGERRRGVAARGREREREVGGAEHRDRAERHPHAPHVGLRDRLRVRIRVVDDRLGVVAGVDDRRERLELPAGALELASAGAAPRAGRSRPRRRRRSRRRPRAGARRRRAAGRTRLARSRSAPDRWTAAAASTAARTSCGDASS